MFTTVNEINYVRQKPIDNFQMSLVGTEKIIV